MSWKLTPSRDACRSRPMNLVMVTLSTCHPVTFQYSRLRLPCTSSSCRSDPWFTYLRRVSLLCKNKPRWSQDRSADVHQKTRRPRSTPRTYSACVTTLRPPRRSPPDEGGHDVTGTTHICRGTSKGAQHSFLLPQL